MGLINLLAERVGVINTSPRFPQESGIILWDEPEPPTTGGEIPHGPWEPRGTEGEWDGPVGAGPRRGDLPKSDGGGPGGGSKKNYYPPGFSGRIPLMDPYVPLFPDSGVPLHGSERGDSGSGSMLGGENTGSRAVPGQVDPKKYLEDMRRGSSVWHKQFVQYPIRGITYPWQNWEREVVKRGFELFFNNPSLRTTLESLDPVLYRDFLDMVHRIHITQGGPCPHLPPGALATAQQTTTASGAAQWVIVLCDSFWDLSFEDQVSTLLHEYMHIFGYSELDSYLLEYIAGFVSSDNPLPNWNATDPAERASALAVWCHIKKDSQPPDNDSSIVIDSNGNMILSGKHYDLNLNNGELWDKSKPRNTWTFPAGNLGGLMPPANWWLLTSPSDGC